MKPFIIFAAVLAFLLVAFQPQTSNAQNGNTVGSTIGIGPRLGYYKSNDAIEGGWYMGGQFRMRFGSIFGAEAAIDYRAAETFKFPTNDGNEYSADVNYVPVTVSLLGIVPLGGIAPYGIAGFGWYHTIVDYSPAFEAIPGHIFTDHSTSVFGYHIGLGLELPVNESAALNFDYRYLFLKSDIQGPADLIDGDVTLRTSDSNGSVWTIGLMLYF